MNYKNIFRMSMLFILTTSFISPRQSSGIAGTKKWLVEENSNLCVNGSTNVNKFACEIPAYHQTDTLTITEKAGGKDVVLSGSIGLRVKYFDCHNVMMTRDLQKTLKEKEFPVFRISFLSLSKLPCLSAKPELITGLVNIEIAGIRKRYKVNYQITEDDHKIIHLLGSQDLNFSDFNLVPPKKFGGVIKTRDKLSVDFNLNIKPME